jgi:uncharacterized glyoxalase superfamily protein PhnB
MPVAVIVFVEDVGRTLAFYEEVLGAELDHVERHLDLSFHPNESGGLPSGFELDLGVDDVDTVFARAIEAGATAVWEPQDKAWGRSALLRDLDGVFIHLTQA